MRFSKRATFKISSRRMLRQFAYPFLLVSGLLLMAGPVDAQGPPEAWDPRSLEVEREDLEVLQDRYRMVLASGAYSAALKRQAEVELARVTERLEQGDFRTGDRIIVRVQGEPGIPDTLFVEPGQAVNIPIIGRIGLDGVLRSELQEHMTREIGRFIQNPVVEARALIRLSIQGSVGRPGFYVVPADLLLGDVIMVAGGPSANADLSKLTIRRGEEVFLEGGTLQEATVEGRSLDQLSLRAGDALIVPAQSRSNLWGQIARYGLVIASTLLLGIRIIP